MSVGRRRRRTRCYILAESITWQSHSEYGKATFLRYKKMVLQTQFFNFLQVFGLEYPLNFVNP